MIIAVMEFAFPFSQLISYACVFASPTLTDVNYLCIVRDWYMLEYYHLYMLGINHLTPVYCLNLKAFIPLIVKKYYTNSQVNEQLLNKFPTIFSHPCTEFESEAFYIKSLDNEVDNFMRKKIILFIQRN